MSNLIKRIQSSYKLNKIKLRIDDFGFNKRFTIDETIAVIGSARSGTTWIMELLLNLPCYVSVFEPFHPRWFPESSELGFSPKPCIIDHECERKLEEYLMRAFTGKLRSRIPKYDFTLGEVASRLRAERLVVKFVRANMILPLIINKFNLRLALFVVRHPYAVIASQLKTGYTGFTNIVGDDYMPTTRELLPYLRALGYDSELINYVSTLENGVETLAANWAIENCLPLTLVEPTDLYMVVYEEMYNNPGDCLKRLLHRMNEGEHYNKILSKIEKPSLSTRIDDIEEVKDRANIVNQWKKQLSVRDTQKISSVLNMFGIEVDDTNYKIGSIMEYP